MVLTFGTGIGSAIFLDGKLLPNSEFGHLPMPMRGIIAEHYCSERIRKEEDLKWGEWAIRTNHYLALLELLLSPDLFIIGGGIASAVTFLGSLYFSNKASDIAERSNVLYSDIDSQNQAHRMVQAFAKAQTQGQVQADNSAPMTSTNTNWSDRVGTPAQASGSWQERVAAQAEREEVQSFNAVSASR